MLRQPYVAIICCNNNEIKITLPHKHSLLSAPSKQRSDIDKAWADIVRAGRDRAIWMALGWNDIQRRYNRSRLGVVWAGLSLIILVSALGPVYSKLMSIELSVYMMHLLLGFILWNFATATVMESAREYVNAENFLVSFQLSYVTLLMRVVWRNCVVLCYQLLVFLLFCLILQYPPNIYWLVAPLALLLIALNALWMGMFVSIFATRYRDLNELLNNLFRLIFFVTPIMWIPSVREELVFIADINPFYHLIELIREPLMYGTMSSRSWLICTLMCIIGWMITFPVFAKYRSRIAFWL